jgi:hypothetical protein
VALLTICPEAVLVDIDREELETEDEGDIELIDVTAAGAVTGNLEAA